MIFNTIRGFLLVTMLALFCTPAQADDRLFQIAKFSYWTTSMMDVSTTMFVLGRGTHREANPLLAPISNDPLAMAFIKASTAGTSILLAEMLHRSHPRLGTIILFGLSVGTGMVAYHNVN